MHSAERFKKLRSHVERSAISFNDCQKVEGGYNATYIRLVRASSAEIAAHEEDEERRRVEAIQAASGLAKIAEVRHFCLYAILLLSLTLFAPLRRSADGGNDMVYPFHWCRVDYALCIPTHRHSSSSFVPLPQVMAASGKPAVGHNCLFDLLYVIDSFVRPLSDKEAPSGWAQFGELVLSQAFTGGVYDTKLLARRLPGVFTGGTSLAEVRRLSGLLVTRAFRAERRPFLILYCSSI